MQAYDTFEMFFTHGSALINADACHGIHVVCVVVTEQNQLLGQLFWSKDVSLSYVHLKMCLS
jgi:hypothetical protein